MNEKQAPITRKSKICQIMPCLEDKALVDLVNNIDVSIAHVGEQDRRSIFLSRLWDGFTGQGLRRQANINASVNHALEGARQWLTNLTDELAGTNSVVAQHGLALAKIDVAVGKLNDGLADLAENAATRRELAHLANEIRPRLDRVEKWVADVEARMHAMGHLERVFSKWEVGQYQGLSALAQCYAALEELRWGAFGYYCHAHSADSKDLLETLENKATLQLSVAGGRSVDERSPTADWLQQPDDPLLDGVDALAYLGEHYMPKVAPFVSVVTQNIPIGRYSLEVPYVVSAYRAATALVGEIFGKRQCE